MEAVLQRVAGFLSRVVCLMCDNAMVVIHHQVRWDQIVQTDPPNDSSQVLQPEGHQAHASSPSRFAQHPGRCSFACGPDHSDRMGSVFIQCFPHGQHKSSIHRCHIHASSVVWDRNGVRPPTIQMLPSVLNKIHSSHDLSVILVALHLMAASWIPEPLKQPRCLHIPLEGHPPLTQELWMPGGHVETRHYWPSNLHVWLLWGICLSGLVTAKALHIASAPIWEPPWLVAMSPAGAEYCRRNASKYLR